MPRLGFYLIFEIGSSEDRRRMPTRWGLESPGSRGIGPNNHVNCFGHSDLPDGPVETDASPRFTAAPASLFDGKILGKSPVSVRTRVKISLLIKHLPGQFPRQETGK
jgi:hypothetical protein